MTSEYKKESKSNNLLKPRRLKKMKTAESPASVCGLFGRGLTKKKLLKKITTLHDVSIQEMLGSGVNRVYYKPNIFDKTLPTRIGLVLSKSFQAFVLTNSPLFSQTKSEAALKSSS